MKILLLYIDSNVKQAERLIKIFEKKFPCCVNYIFENNLIRLEVWCLEEDESLIQKALDTIK